jgi:hypothetical protein
LRSRRPCCISMAQRTSSTTLRNSIRLPSPLRLTIARDARRWRARSGRCEARADARECGPRRLRRADCIRRRPPPGSRPACGSRHGAARPSPSGHSGEVSERGLAQADCNVVVRPGYGCTSMLH